MQETLGSDLRKFIVSTMQGVCLCTGLQMQTRFIPKKHVDFLPIRNCTAKEDVLVICFDEDSEVTSGCSVCKT